MLPILEDVAMEKNIVPETQTNVPDQTENYIQLLQFYTQEFKPDKYHLIVGSPMKPQGWILHLSVVLSQVYKLLETVIPFLLEENANFKIPSSLTVAGDILSGGLGLTQIGKLITIFPENDRLSVSLAKKLIELTKSFKGPRIPSDNYLGGIVYTRYGAFQPIIQLGSDGKEENYIYNSKNELTRDIYSVPFQIPEGVLWPFEEISPYAPSSPFAEANSLCRPTSILKVDPRGNVYKGIYLKGLLSVKKCVIKQGHKNMNSDLSGRDIQDRLAWQKELHNKLGHIIPLPKIYDFYQQDETSYLVMEYISGISLFDKRKQINPLSSIWHELSSKGLATLVGFAIDIARLVGLLHRNGYVHRDIVPVNFLIDKKDKVFPIDMELAFSIQEKKPSPPFALGTPGFASPEQLASCEPTVKEDIYGFGATLMEVFTGLSPIKFDTREGARFYTQLLLFIGDEEMTDIITDCLNHDPAARPDMASILIHLTKFKEQLSEIKKRENKKPIHSLRNEKALQETVAASINGLVLPPIPFHNELWYSTKDNAATPTALRSRQYTPIPSLREGIGGILYTLSKLYSEGYNIESCKPAYVKGWNFIKEKYLNGSTNISPGFYDGAAGLAVSMAKTIDCGLLEDNETHRTILYKCLQLPNSEISLGNGLAGQCLAILRCKEYLPRGIPEFILENKLEHLLRTQQKNGWWPLTRQSNEAEAILSFGYGLTGVLWFLLEYGSLTNKKEPLLAADKTLNWLLTNKSIKDKIQNWPKYNREVRGVILLLLKAHETLDNKLYKQIADSTLLNYPKRIVSTDFTQKSGLAGLGELYIEAYRITRNEEWMCRADWIANVFLNTFIKASDHSGYWIMEEAFAPTAGFISGVNGILHFLARYINLPSEMGYPLLK
jgi:serine/threonine protein kinase